MAFGTLSHGVGCGVGGAGDYLLRKPKHPDTDGVRILALMEGARALFAST